MCGIVGVQVARRTDSATFVSRIIELMHHRGPDARGDEKRGVWHIGAARLSIIDRENGHQPFSSSDGRWLMVFNGEIYNHKYQREILIKSGTNFRTSTDTEVLVELIARHGFVAALEKVEGMFGVAAIDTISDDLWLARDRFGEKPLFLDRRDSGFAFCSEISPLLIEGSSRPRSSPGGIISILRFGYATPGITAVDGIEEIKPGQWLKRRATGEEQSGFYWLPPDRIDEEAGPVERCGRKLDDLLAASVRDRLSADVPIGLFLSGGIDSAAVASAASGLIGRLPAVTIGFRDHRYDERPGARKTAAALGLELHEETCDAFGFSPNVVDELLFHYGQPFGDTSAVPTRLLARTARKHFTVALSGDGGDEIFCGYRSFVRQRQLRTWGGGKLGARLSELGVRHAPLSAKWDSVRRALELNSAVHSNLFGHVFDGVFEDNHILLLSRGTDWERLGHEQLIASREKAIETWMRIKDPLLALSTHLIASSLPQDMLMKMDRMSMAESMEVRAPLLDSRLASFALALPPHLKMKGTIGKQLLRRSLVGKIPKQVLQSPKRGFELPLGSWLKPTFRSCLRAEIENYQDDPDAELNGTELDKLVKQNAGDSFTGVSYRSRHRLWLLYIYLRWRHIWCQDWKQSQKHSNALP